MEIKRFEAGPLAANCYFVYSGENAVVIDPGYPEKDLMDTVSAFSGRVRYILLTHSHIDHVAAAGRIRELTSAPIAIHEAEDKKWNDPAANLSFDIDGYGFTAACRGTDIILNDNDLLTAGDMSIRVMHTPGHSVGSVCFLVGEHMFSGDTLFKGSVGRYDLPTGDFNTLRASLAKLSALNDDYCVYPGHGPQTSLFYESNYNPYMVGL